MLGRLRPLHLYTVFLQIHAHGPLLLLHLQTRTRPMGLGSLEELRQVRDQSLMHKRTSLAYSRLFKRPDLPTPPTRTPNQDKT